MEESSPTVVDVAEHPDHREIATFFLGWAFVTSLQCIFLSGLGQDMFSRLIHHSRTSTDSEKGLESEISKAGFMTTSSLGLFILSLCFAFASLARFAALLSFDEGGDTACAFLVAWGVLSSQLARLVSLCIILVALRRLGIGRYEASLYVIGLLVSLGLVLTTSAVGTGSISEYKEMSIFLCHRQHMLGLSLGTSFMYSSIDVYAIGRTLSMTYSQSRHVVHRLGDTSVVQAVSLLVLELLTVVPNALFTDVLGESIPFSVGAIFVLWAFNRRRLELTATNNENTSAGIALRSPYLKSQPDAFSIKSRQSIDSLPRRSVPQSVLSSPATIPYVANYESGLVPDDDKRTTTGYRTARSSRTVDSGSLRSVGEAVVEVARRSRYQFVRRSMQDIETAPRLDPIMPLIKARLIMVYKQRKDDDGLVDRPLTAEICAPEVMTDPLKSRFSVSTRTFSAYPMSDTSSLPSSPSKSDRRVSGLSSVLEGLTSTVPSPRDAIPALPDSPSIQSRDLPLPERTSRASDRTSEDVQIVTITPPAPEGNGVTVSPVTLQRVITDGRSKQFKAAGYVNPIPTFRVRREVAGPAEFKEQEGI